MKTLIMSLIAALAIGQATAATFNAFPENTFTCHVSMTETKSITRAELEALVTDPAGRVLIERSASNMASGPVCSTIRQPLYGKSAFPWGDIRFAVDASTDTYWLCSGIGYDVDGTGYGSGCWGN